MARFYIATRLERAADHNRVRDALHAAGHRITYDWTKHGSVRHVSTEVMADVAGAELRGVYLANFVVVLLPGGRGTHLELGAALAWRRPVVLHAESPLAEASFGLGKDTCAFYHHPLVRHVTGPLDALIEAIQQDPRICQTTAPLPL